MHTFNGVEAISALQSGKTVLCRHIGGLLDFDELNQFPATVFFTNDHEFCIKRETLTLADIQFTKPVQPHDLESGQEIFIVMPTCILRTKYDPEHGDISLSVANGFAQLDAENAQLQLQAFGKTFGNMITEIEIKDGFSEKPKKSKAPRKTKEAFTTEDTPEIETDPTLIIDKFAAQIANCTTTEAVLLLRPVFFANGHLEREHTQHLCKLTEDKLIELDPEKYAPKLTSLDHQIYIDGINSCESEQEIEITLRDLDTQGFSAEQLLEITMAKEIKLGEFLTPILSNSQENLTTIEDQMIEQTNPPELHPYQSVLDELLERLKVVKTPKEANALYKYTLHWTEEERKPAMDAIHKRLAEFNPPEKSQSSLMVRIEEAKTLIELTKLEDEISECDPLIQERLTSYVSQRRSDLMMETDIPWEAKN